MGVVGSRDGRRRAIDREGGGDTLQAPRPPRGATRNAGMDATHAPPARQARPPITTTPFCLLFHPSFFPFQLIASITMRRDLIGAHFHRL